MSRDIGRSKYWTMNLISCVSSGMCGLQKPQVPEDTEGIYSD